MIDESATTEQASVGVPMREALAEMFASREPESNFSVMCERAAERRASVGVECKACEGVGYRLLTEAEMAYWKERIDRQSRHEDIELERRAQLRSSRCNECEGHGYVAQRPDDESDQVDAVATTVMCSRCRGSDDRHARKNEAGSQLYPSLMHRHWGTSCGETIPPNDATAELGDVCPVCLGDAYVVPITARPRMRTADEGTTWVAVEEVDPGFVTWQRLRRIEEPEAEAKPDDLVALAIRAWVGEHGDTWAMHHWGRRFALWPLTEAGQRLFEEASAASAETDWFARRLDVLKRERQAELDVDRPSPRRRNLITLADSEARALERRAREALKAIEAA
jgi:hypothetical protein